MRPTTLLLLSTLLLSADVAAAAPLSASNLRDILRVARPTVPTPAAWSGVWDIVINIYQCGGGLLQTVSETDTLCTGQEISEEPPGTDVPPTCTGFADDTTVDMTCTGTGDYFPDCTVSYVAEIDGTRTADSYSLVSIINSTYEGTGTGCEFLPDSCIRVEVTGTRTGPEPSDYCATPTLPSTWGRVKAQYR